jgi:CheY-like chemotaxis protein
MEHGPFRILVLNDDAALARSVRALLAETGYEVRTAGDGAEGLAELRCWPADLVLLDLIMPRLDGWEFLARLPHLGLATPPVVLVWSIAGASELEYARGLGATACLPRASTGPQQLLDAIERLLRPLPMPAGR